MTGEEDASSLRGRMVGELLPDATRTDCRAMCVAADGTVWAGVAARTADGDAGLRLVSYSPKTKAIVDHGRAVIRNPDYTTFKDTEGKPLKWHHGHLRCPRWDGLLHDALSADVARMEIELK